MKILLDTSAFILLLRDSGRFHQEMRNHIQQEAQERFLSIISAWEIFLKHGLGKLALAAAPEILIPEECARRGIAILSLGLGDMARLAKLPAIHRDPFDRMLVCQAIEQGCTMITADGTMARYPIRTILI